MLRARGETAALHAEAGKPQLRSLGFNVTCEVWLAPSAPKLAPEREGGTRWKPQAPAGTQLSRCVSTFRFVPPVLSLVRVKFVLGLERDVKPSRPPSLTLLVQKPLRLGRH